MATKSSRAAFKTLEERRRAEKERVYLENKGVELTQRKQAAQKLQERHQRMEALRQMKATHMKQCEGPCVSASPVLSYGAATFCAADRGARRQDPRARGVLREGPRVGERG